MIMAYTRNSNSNTNDSSSNNSNRNNNNTNNINNNTNNNNINNNNDIQAALAPGLAGRSANLPPRLDGTRSLLFVLLFIWVYLCFVLFVYVYVICF